MFIFKGKDKEKQKKRSADNEQDLRPLERGKDIEKFVEDVRAQAISETTSAIEKKLNVSRVIPYALRAARDVSIVVVLVHFALPWLEGVVRDPTVVALTNAFDTTNTLAAGAIGGLGVVLNAKRNLNIAKERLLKEEKRAKEVFVWEGRKARGVYKKTVELAHTIFSVQK